MKTIVVGVDSSERSALVLADAVKLAQAFGAKLLPVRAVGIPVELPFEAMQIGPNQLADSVVEAAKASLSRIVATLPQGTYHEPEVHLGTPWQVVCDAAERANADLVVVGTHTRTVLDRMLGTTSARIVNHAPCSVYVVRYRD